jgi:histidine triad (HIT) family protein
MTDCIFCKIIDQEIEAKIIYENENALAFLDINPHAPGHTVIIPKKHYANILEAEDSDLSYLFLVVKKVAALLQKSLKAEGFTIGINHGKIAGQAIGHLHIHLIPRFNGDGGGSIHSVVLNKPKESIDEIYKKIKNYGN